VLRTQKEYKESEEYKEFEERSKQARGSWSVPRLRGRGEQGRIVRYTSVSVGNASYVHTHSRAQPTDTVATS
jgi:hypothetical protein